MNNKRYIIIAIIVFILQLILIHYNIHPLQLDSSEPDTFIIKLTSIYLSITISVFWIVILPLLAILSVLSGLAWIL